MMKPSNCALMLLLLGLFMSLSASADDSRVPVISTQDFCADQPQKGVVGKYPRLRVRIEAPDRLKGLSIKERSYDVDLAMTKDKNNLQLFGLEQSPRSYTDVTLNLQKYINKKIHKEGEYEFHLMATDGSNNSVEKKIFVHVHEAMSARERDIAEDKRLLKTAAFAFQRTGINSVKGGQLFDINWKTTDHVNVVIGITKSENSNTHLSVLDKLDFDEIQTIDQLVQRVADQEETEVVVLTTSRNRAAGEVFSIRHEEKYYIFKVMESSAYPSANGTIVTVKGYYKYQGMAE